MAFIVLDDALGFVDLYLVDTVGPAPEGFSGTTQTGYGRTNFPGLTLRGYDPALGAGTFVFAKAVAAVTQYSTCELTQSVTSGRYDVSAQPWAGAANTGKLLAVPLATLSNGQWGWFQVQGLAIATCQGAPVAGNPAYWQASGVVSPTAVNGKQMLNAQFASAPAVTIGSGNAAVVLSATQALLLINSPFAQGQVT